MHVLNFLTCGKIISFPKHRFRPRILIDVSKIDMTTTVLGFKISMPIMIAPTAMQKMAHPEGIFTYSCKPFCLLMATTKNCL